MWQSVCCEPCRCAWQNTGTLCLCQIVCLCKEHDCISLICMHAYQLGCLQADQARQQESSDSPAAVPLGHVHLCDINPGMLQEGYKKAAQNGLGRPALSLLHVCSFIDLPSSYIEPVSDHLSILGLEANH